MESCFFSVRVGSALYAINNLATDVGVYYSFSRHAMSTYRTSWFLAANALYCTVPLIARQMPSFQLGTVTLAGWLAAWLVVSRVACLSAL